MSLRNRESVMPQESKKPALSCAVCAESDGRIDEEAEEVVLQRSYDGQEWTDGSDGVTGVAG